MTGGINHWWWRHDSTRGAWKGASLGSNSCIHLGSWNEALTSQASLQISSSPGTVDNSAHQLGVSHSPTFHLIQLENFNMASSCGISSLPPSDIPDDPSKKEATSALSFGGSPKLEVLSSDSVLSGDISGSVDQLGVGLLAKLAQWHLSPCIPSDLWQCQLLGLTSDWKWHLI